MVRAGADERRRASTGSREVLSARCAALYNLCVSLSGGARGACEPAKNGKAVSFWNKRRELRQRDEAAPSLIDEAVPVDVS